MIKNKSHTIMDHWDHLMDDFFGLARCTYRYQIHGSESYENIFIWSVLKNE